MRNRIIIGPGLLLPVALAIEIAVIVWIFGCASPAEAQAGVVCGVYEQMAAALRDHGEAPVVRGLDVRGFVAEAWASPAGGWTWISIAADGRACMVAAGEAAEVIALQPEERQG